MARRYFEVLSPILCQDQRKVDIVEVGYRTTSQALPDTVAGDHRDGFQLGGGQLGSCRAGEVEADCDHLEGPFSGYRGATGRRGNVPRALFRGMRSAVGASRLSGEIAERINRKVGRVPSRGSWKCSRCRHSVTRPAARISPEGVNEYIRADRERWKVLASGARPSAKVISTRLVSTIRTGTALVDRSGERHRLEMLRQHVGPLQTAVTRPKPAISGKSEVWENLRAV